MKIERQANKNCDAFSVFRSHAVTVNTRSSREKRQINVSNESSELNEGCRTVVSSSYNSSSGLGGKWLFSVFVVGRESAFTGEEKNTAGVKGRG